MQPPNPQDDHERRISGEAECPQAKVPSYQELLDYALEETFPASDPLAVSVALHAHEPRTTPRDCRDWTLKPGACPPVGQPSADDGQGSVRSAPCDVWLTAPLPWGGSQVPAGPCKLEQSAESATLQWLESGKQRRMDLSLEALQRLLASGQLRRPDLK